MGRQVNFFMNADDQARMNAIILTELPETVILKPEMAKQQLEFLNTTEQTNEESLWILLARRQDVKKIFIDPPFRTKIPPFKIRNIVNLDVSPVVDYHRCGILARDPGGARIQRGRLYFHAFYYIDNFTKKISKDPDFVKFTQKLFNLFKKNLIYKKDFGDYFGEGALRDEKNGWKLMT